MNKLFVPYEIAKALKEKGFDEPCLSYWYTTNSVDPKIRVKDMSYDGYINEPDQHTTAPLYQQVFDWFRENHKIHIGIGLYYDGFDVDVRNFNNDTSFETHHKVLEYYEALNIAIIEALKLIK